MIEGNWRQIAPRSLNWGVRADAGATPGAGAGAGDGFDMGLSSERPSRKVILLSYHSILLFYIIIISCL